MDFVPSNLANPSTIAGSTLTGVTIVASTISGATIFASSISGATITNSTINSGSTVSVFATTARQFVSVYRSLSGQTITNTTNTLVHHNAEASDADGLYDNSTYTFTATATGQYLVTAAIGFLGMASGNLVKSRIYKNGNNVFESNVESVGSNISAVANALVTITGVGGTIQHYVYQDSGGDLDADNTAATSYLQIMWASK